MHSTLLQLLSVWGMLHLLHPAAHFAAAEAPEFEHPELKALTGQSFRGPFSENVEVPGFEVSGFATRLATSPDFLRLGQPIPLANGAIFSTDKVKSDGWIVEIAVRVHGASAGRAHGKGGRGLAFWYTKNGTPLKNHGRPTEASNRAEDAAVSFFGNTINFDGLGIVMDTAPSAPVLKRSDPSGWIFGADNAGVITALIDDGKTGERWFDDHKEGQSREGSEAKYIERAAGECEAGFRNAPGLVWVRIAHFNSQIRVDLDLQPHTTLSQEKRHFSHHCFTVNDVRLPKGYHFGLSSLAAGNTDPDAVDIYAFDAWEVVGKSGEGDHVPPPVVKGKEKRTPLTGTTEEASDDASSMLLEILAAQSRITSAVDALARRVDELSSKQSSSSQPVAVSGGAVDLEVRSRLEKIQNLLGIANGEGVLQQLDALGADVRAMNVKMDALTARINKNIGSISSRIGELLNFANKMDPDSPMNTSMLKPSSGIGEMISSIVLWVFGGVGLLSALGFAFIAWQKRSKDGGRGKKMI